MDGAYKYFGIKNGIKELIGKNLVKSRSIALDLNIDGLPLFKSSSTQFWPILGRVEGHIFVISLYCGTSKPPLIPFLQKVISEMKEFISD